MRKHLPKIKLMAPLGLFLIALFVGIIFLSNTNTSTNKTPASLEIQQTSVQNKQVSKDITLIATGDFIAHDSVNNAALKADGSYDYLPLMQEFERVFSRNDIRYCNDPILNGGKALGITGYPKFNSPTEFVRDMGRVGCNLVSTASNHSFDFSQNNINASIDAWSSVSGMLAVAGQNKTEADKNKLNIFTVKGVKFAFLSYTTYTNRPVQNSYGVNLFDKTIASRQIAEAKQNGVQFVIVSMRWGTEYSSTANAQQIDYAQFLADQGVNLILGHGPHQLQPVEKLTGKSGNSTLVWYSLGNFLNTQESAETLVNGLATMTIDTSTMQVSRLGYIPIYMHYEWSAQQAVSKQYLTRSNVRLYLLEQVSQQMIDAQQLKTTVDAQKQRLQQTLNAKGLNIPLISREAFLVSN